MAIFELLKTMLLSPFGSFAFVLAFFWMCGWLIYKVTKFITEHKRDIQDLEKEENRLTTELTNHIKEHNDLNKDIAYIKSTLELMRFGKTNEYAQSHSPISLTEKGLNLANELRLNDIIENNWIKIKLNIDNAVQDKNPYDIQQYCIETLTVEPSQFLDEDAIHILKQHAFNIGQVFQSIIIVPAILIRDRYFKERNIPIEDIDKYAP